MVMKYFLLAAVLAVYQQGCMCESNPAIWDAAQMGMNAINVGTHTMTNMAGDAFNYIPSPKDIARMSKETFLGMPPRFIMEGVNMFCSMAMQFDVNLGRNERYMPNIQNMSFVFYDNGRRIPFHFTELDKLTQYPGFNKDNKLVLFITGWLTKENTENAAARELAKAYACRGNHTFIHLDTEDYLDNLYTWSALNTEEIGQLVAPYVAKLVDYVNFNETHIIGHSLGAHVAGSIGRHFINEKKKLLPRITGLDPARPCFNEGEVMTNLQRGDAEFVDIIHTNNGGLGKREPIGDADFYPNGMSVLMPGCLGIICSHLRAYEYYTETVYPENRNGFQAVRCNSLRGVTTRKCKGDPIPMGYACPLNAKGNFFLEVNAHGLYGQYSKSNTKCNK
ncbi:phospholipase A1-like [Lutzomyia longipalpis]|uniref:Putative vitellogenin-1 n=1 Tax=Lutzomyia longipalpis TaxID=7200 RepID=A0A7G3B467_LUTLO|nr:phospholipase A1-like [Lutzomyia longipalpis]